MTTTNKEYELPKGDILPLQSAAMLDSEVEKERKRAKNRALSSLTQRGIDRALARKDEYTIYHKTLPGFGLRVRPSGHKTFTLTFRKRGKNKSTRVVVGHPSTMSLEEAEERAHKMLQNLRDYGDPEGEQYLGKKWTFKELFKAYKEEYAEIQLSENWRKQCEQLFQHYVEPEFGHRIVREVSRGDLTRSITSHRSPHIQHHIKSLLSSMYSWGVALEYVPENIIRDIRVAKTKSRDRYLSGLEIASVYNATHKLSSPFDSYAKFLILSGQRRSEVARMTWDELDFEQKIWTLPASRSKNKCQHTIPLTSAALELLAQLPRTSKYVFESQVNKGNPINSFGKMVTHWKKHTWAKDWRLHDLRRTAASGMGEIGVFQHVIGAVLNHRTITASGITAVYNRYQYDKEKRDALERWQAHLLKTVEEHKDYVPPQDDDCVEL